MKIINTEQIKEREARQKEKILAVRYRGVCPGFLDSAQFSLPPNMVNRLF